MIRFVFSILHISVVQLRSLKALLAICLFAGSGAVAACDHTLKFGMVSYPPYIGFDADGKAYGLDADILDHVMRGAGCDYVLREVPFKRALRDVHLGDLDGIPGVSRTPDRLKGAYFTLPIRREFIGAYARKGDSGVAHIRSFDDMVAAKNKIGIVLGGWYGKAFMDAFENNPAFHARIQNSEDFLTLFRRLDAGVIDIAIGDLLSGHHISMAHGMQRRLEPMSAPVNINDVYLMLSKKTIRPQDLETINAAIERLESSAAYDRIMKAHAPDAIAALLRLRR